MSRDTAPSPDTAVPEVPTMELRHLHWCETRRESALPTGSEVCALVRSLSSGRGVVVQREEIEEVGRLATDAAEAAFWADEARGKRAANRIAEIAYHWSRPPAEDRT
jgi:hypothetical protein